MSDDTTVLIVVGAVVGTLGLALLMFYSAYQRVPYWLSNMLRIPPVWSCNQSYSPACSLNDISISSRMIFVGVLPFVFLSVLCITVLVHKPHDASGGWNDFVPLLDCAAEVAKEQSAKTIDLINGTTNDFMSRVRATDLTCRELASAELVTARASNNFADAYNLYQKVFSAVITQAMEKQAANGEEDVRQLQELLTLLSALTMDNDCSALRDATKVHAHFNNQAVEMNVLGAWGAKYSIVGRMLSYSLSNKSVMEAYADNVERNDLRNQLLETRQELVLPVIDIILQAANITTQVRSLVSRIYVTTSGELSSSFDDFNYGVFLLTTLMGLSLGISAITAIASVLLLLMHKREIQGDIIIKKDFDDCDTHKDKLQTYVNYMGTLQLENVNSTTSVVERRFYEMSMNLLTLKPFISHSLFEGDLGDVTEEHPGGRTHAYSLRTEIGMCFTPCSCMAVSTEMFNDITSQHMQERRADLTADYSALIGLVTSVASKTGGVVHHIGGGVMTCTWNCTIACDQSSERALSAAFTLEHEFEEAAKNKMFQLIPDTRLQIAVSSGDVMGGLIKALPSRKLLIGLAPLQAERMVYMCPLHSMSILIDQDTQTRLSNRYYTKPVMVIKDSCIYETLPKQPDTSEKLKDYNECFVHLRKNKNQLALQSLEAYLAKPASRGDKSAKFLRDRIALKVKAKHSTTPANGNTAIMPL